MTTSHGLFGVLAGLSLALLSSQALASPFSLEQAKADQCETQGSWVANLGYPGGDGPYVAVCGDDDEDASVPGAGDLQVNSCQAKAELEWAIAYSAGVGSEMADAAYEDAYASCTEGR